MSSDRIGKRKNKLILAKMTAKDAAKAFYDYTFADTDTAPQDFNVVDFIVSTAEWVYQNEKNEKKIKDFMLELNKLSGTKFLVNQYYHSNRIQDSHEAQLLYASHQLITDTDNKIYDEEVKRSDEKTTDALFKKYRLETNKELTASTDLLNSAKYIPLDPKYSSLLMRAYKRGLNQNRLIPMIVFAFLHWFFTPSKVMSDAYAKNNLMSWLIAIGCILGLGFCGYLIEKLIVYLASKNEKTAPFAKDLGVLASAITVPVTGNYIMSPAGMATNFMSQASTASLTKLGVEVVSAMYSSRVSYTAGYYLTLSSRCTRDNYGSCKLINSWLPEKELIKTKYMFIARNSGKGYSPKERFKHFIKSVTYVWLKFAIQDRDRNDQLFLYWSLMGTKEKYYYTDLSELTLPVSITKVKRTTGLGNFVKSGRANVLRTLKSYIGKYRDYFIREEELKSRSPKGHAAMKAHITACAKLLTTQIDKCNENEEMPFDEFVLRLEEIDSKLIKKGLDLDNLQDTMDKPEEKKEQSPPPTIIEETQDDSAPVAKPIKDTALQPYPSEEASTSDEDPDTESDEDEKEEKKHEGNEENEDNIPVTLDPEIVGEVLSPIAEVEKFYADMINTGDAVPINPDSLFPKAAKLRVLYSIDLPKSMDAAISPDFDKREFIYKFQKLNELIHLSADKKNFSKFQVNLDILENLLVTQYFSPGVSKLYHYVKICLGASQGAPNLNVRRFSSMDIAQLTTVLIYQSMKLSDFRDHDNFKNAALELQTVLKNFTTENLQSIGRFVGYQSSEDKFKMNIFDAIDKQLRSLTQLSLAELEQKLEDFLGYNPNQKIYLKTLRAISGNTQGMIPLYAPLVDSQKTDNFLDKLIDDIEASYDIVTDLQDRMGDILFLTNRRLKQRLSKDQITLAGKDNLLHFLAGDLFELYETKKNTVGGEDLINAYPIACRKFLSGHRYLYDNVYSPIYLTLNNQKRLFYPVEIRENRHAAERYFALKDKDTDQFLLICKTKAVHKIDKYQSLIRPTLKKLQE